MATRREFLTTLLMAAGCAALSPLEILASRSPEQEIKRILGEVEVLPPAMLRNGGEMVSSILGDYKGKIEFSLDYIKRKPEEAREELIKMHSIKKRFPEIDSVYLWNAHRDEASISRGIRIGEFDIEIEEGWKTIQRREGILINYGIVRFYIPYPSLSLDKSLVDTLAGLKKSPLEYQTEEIWGLTVDVFKSPEYPYTVLKGKNSTILYDERKNKFVPGGMWRDSAKIVKTDPRQGTIEIDEDGYKWLVVLEDTSRTTNASAYKAIRL